MTIQNALFDNRIYLSKQITNFESQQRNEFELLENVFLEYLHFLELPFGKTSSKIERDLTLRTILIKYYGIDGRNYDKEEIGLLVDKHPERIRQLILQFIDTTKEIFNDENQQFKVDTNLAESLKIFYNTLYEVKIISLNNFQNLLAPSKIVKEGIVNLFFDVFEITKRAPIAHHLKDNEFLFIDPLIKINDFFEICYLVYLFFEKNILYSDLEDVIIDVKKKRPESKNEIIEIACNQIQEIENTIVDGKKKYQLKFQYLSNAKDMCYRLLNEKGEFLKLAYIIKEVNHILSKNDITKRIKSTVATQLSSDPRFASQGKLGNWGLSEWQGSNESLFDLIKNTLMHFNKPLTKNEIFSYIHKSRPKIPTRSLDTIIYDRSRYIKLSDNTFVLAEWRDIYKDRIAVLNPRVSFVKENPIKDQIKQQAIQLLQKDESKNLYLKSIIYTLSQQFSFRKASIYKVLSVNSEFVTSTDENGKKIISLKIDEINAIQSKTNISVFVSYSWESKEHQDKVISFVDFMRKKGFNADLDIRIMQDETAVDFNRLMHKAIKDYDKVILILSPSYKIKAEAFEGGVGKEYRYVLNHIDKAPKKFILSTFLPITTEILDLIVPLDFKGREIVNLKNSEMDGFQNLFSKLTDVKRYQFSEVANSTPAVEKIEIKPFTLKDN